MVRAICAAAGFTLAPWEPDNGIDFSIRRLSGRLRRGPVLDVQVKSSRTMKLAGDDWRYELDEQAFQDLSRTDSQGPPAYLFLVRVPKIQHEYMPSGMPGTSFKAKTYWHSLEGMDDGVPHKRSRTISVPCEQVLTVESLIELYNKACQGFTPTVPGQMRGGV
ncbi:DUF4365 domain-containing protein [Glycomyces sp. NPDC047010]|uniref:DUF4365 domain-containing protein n=1 Tax=Glycomyces sp. NPDC047010 TaxID=3155023 RepID=UPI0033C3F334